MSILFLDPLILMMKHDSKDPFQNCPIMFQSSDQVMSHYPDLEPINLNLYSNLIELDHLRDLHDAKLSLAVSYPRDLTLKRLSWKQSNNPFKSEDVSGFQALNIDDMYGPVFLKSGFFKISLLILLWPDFSTKRTT